MVDEPVRVTPHVEKKMVYYARQAAPLEACALLFGQDGVIDEYYPMINTDESEVHFTFDPKEQLHAGREARDRGKDEVGVYHSHPDPSSRAYPSEEDRRMASPGYVYFILNFPTADQDEYDLGAFEFVDDEIVELDYVVEDNG